MQTMTEIEYRMLLTRWRGKRASEACLGDPREISRQTCYSFKTKWSRYRVSSCCLCWCGWEGVRLHRRTP